MSERPRASPLDPAALAALACTNCNRSGMELVMFEPAEMSDTNLDGYVMRCTCGHTTVHTIKRE